MKKKTGIVILVLCLLVCLCSCSPNDPYKHNHNFIEEVVPPTCSNDGYTLYVCTTCGYKAAGLIIPALQNGGHNYVECICTECGDFLIDEAVDTLSLQYEKITDESGNEAYSVTGVTEENGYIKIPSTYNGLPVIKIANKAFWNVLKLKHIIIPESVVSIGDAAFEYCLDLVSVTISSSALSLGRDVFWDCRNLKDISFAGISELNDCVFLGCGSIENIVLTDKITEIDMEAFADCYGLKSITIPTSVTTIDVKAFNNCYNLTDIFYNGTTEQWQDISKFVGTNIYGKDVSWDAYTKEYTVHCTNGDIEKNQTEL